MKIGLIIYGDIDTVSGGYIYDKMLVNYLRDQGDQVDIISITDKKYFRNIGRNYSKELIKKVAGSGFDILLEDELCHPSIFRLNSKLKKILNRPIVAIVHHLRSSEPGLRILRALYWVIERQYLLSVDGFIFNSHATESIARRHCPKIGSYVVAYPGRDFVSGNMSIDEIRHRIHLKRPLQILYVGNLIPRKNVHGLIRALKKIPQNKWELKIIGSLTADPGYSKRIQDLVMNLGLSENILFLGVLGNEDLAAHMSQADIMAMPSLYEGFGMAYIEAQGFGLPVIASTNGGGSEIIANAVNGYLVDPYDIDKMAEHIDSLDNNPDLLLQMSLAAYDRFQKHPTWDESMATIREYLLKVRNLL